MTVSLTQEYYANQVSILCMESYLGILNKEILIKDLDIFKDRQLKIQREILDNNQLLRTEPDVANGYFMALQVLAKADIADRIDIIANKDAQ